MQLGKQKTPYVLFLTKQKLLWLGESLKNVVVMESGDGAIQDLEFKSVKGFENQIHTAYDQKMLKPWEAIIIVSDELFFSQVITQQTEDEIKAYLTVIPFDEVISKQIIAETQKVVVAIGKGLIDPLVEILHSQGFVVTGIFPNLIFGERLKTEEQFTPELVSSLLPILENAQLQSLYTPPKTQETMTGIRDAQGNIFSPRLIGMILFFITLIAILGAVLYSNGYFTPKAPPVIPPATQQPIEEVLPTLQPVEEEIGEEIVIEASSDATSTSSALPTIQTALRIEVLNGSSVNGRADEIKEALSGKGFKTVSTGNTTTVTPKTIIFHTAAVTPATLTSIIDVLKAKGFDSSTQESAELSEIEIRIVVGQQ